jgi:hypothetical protein
MSAMYAARFTRKVVSLVLAGAPIDSDAGDGPVKRMAHTPPTSHFMNNLPGSARRYHARRNHATRERAGGDAYVSARTPGLKAGASMGVVGDDPIHRALIRSGLSYLWFRHLGRQIPGAASRRCSPLS